MKKLFCFLLSISGLLLSNQVLAKTETQHGEIQCGTSTFKEESVIELLDDHDIQYREQKISVYEQGDKNGKPIYHPARSMSQPFMLGIPVLDTATELWVCLKSQDKHYYLYVDYQCIPGQQQPPCEGGANSETFYLYDTKGNNLTPDILHNNSGSAEATKEQDKLWKSLKIYHVMKDSSMSKLNYIHPLDAN
jgi:hypothetical protein